jgi:hypothetical protein
MIRCPNREVLMKTKFLSNVMSMNPTVVGSFYLLIRKLHFTVYTVNVTVKYLLHVYLALAHTINLITICVSLKIVLLYK